MTNVFKSDDFKSAIVFCVIFLIVLFGISTGPEKKSVEKTGSDQTEKIEQKQTGTAIDNQIQTTQNFKKKIEKRKAAAKKVCSNFKAEKVVELEKPVEKHIRLDIDDKIQKALDDEKFEDIQELVPQVSICGNTETRMNMVHALSWFGFKAAPELAAFLCDPDEDVLDETVEAVNSAVSECENDKDAADTVAVIMKSKSSLSDSDMEDIAMHLNMLNDPKIAVRAVIDIMEEGRSETGKKWANDSYKFILGIDEDYTTKEAAEKALAEYIEENGSDQ